MSIFDEDGPAKPRKEQVVVGEDLSNHSEEDLAERITALQEEISRTKDILQSRSNIRNEAESLFGKSSKQ